MKIPVIVVDDEKVDRYTVRRRLAKHGGFDEVQEARSGDDFLERFCTGHICAGPKGDPLLVLIDINMPGRDGFETIAELEDRVRYGQSRASVVAMMFSSSTNPRDKARADALKLVSGYVEKPMSAEGAQRVFELYRAATGPAH